MRGLNLLVTWNYSGGSIIEENVVARWTVNDPENERLLGRAADTGGIEFRVSRVQMETRARNLQTTQHAPVIGRVLSVLGAPVGTKNPAADTDIPTFLTQMTEMIGRARCPVYLLNRGIDPSGRDIIRLKRTELQRISPRSERCSSE